MPQHEKQQCPRCSNSFECKAGTILLCQCSGIEMSEQQTEYCKAQYEGCLCLSCLKELCIEHDKLSKHE